MCGKKKKIRLVVSQEIIDLMTIHYRSNSTKRQEQAGPLSKELPVGVERRTLHQYLLGNLNVRLSSHTRRYMYAPKDKQGTPMGEAGGTGGVAFDGIRHGFERGEGVVFSLLPRGARSVNNERAE